MKRHHECSAKPQAAFTLLEMVLALALFLGAITVLAQVAWNGQRAAIQSRLRTEAAFRCESKLAELLAGAEPFTSQQGSTFPDDTKWSYSTQIAAGKFPELMHVKVTVHHHGNSPATNAEFSLERWTRNPSQFAAAAAQQSASKVTTSTSSSTPTTGSTPTSGTSKSTGGSK